MGNLPVKCKSCPLGNMTFPDGQPKGYDRGGVNVMVRSPWLPEAEGWAL
jgi:hypothetical protein